MSIKKPRMTVLAGTNGAGKSTITKRMNHEIGEIIDLDQMVREQQSDYFTVGKQVIRLVDQYIESRTSFSIETTLSSQIIFKQIERAKSNDFNIHSFYVGLLDVDLHLLRVQERVRRGGHFISEEDIRRRFVRSIRNLPKLIQLSDFTSVIDNTISPKQLLSFEANRLVFQNKTLPNWVSENLRDFFMEN